jgi:antitoxin component YwqK of YwqJK toxin-antitoxin module
MKSEAKLLLKIGLGVFALAVLAGSSGYFWKRSRVHQPWEARTLQQIDFARATPITPELLAHNPLRRAAGLRELPATALVAPTNLRICDGPTFRVVLDAQRRPVLVIAEGGGRRYEPVWTEYEVRNGALTGPSATWRGTPPQLFETAAYRQNKREGLTVYYGSNGTEFARCEYRADQPWSGRLIQRQGFAPVLWNVGYRDGLLSGTEIQFDANGSTNRLRTFQAGVEHGVQRQYHLGVLRSEELIDSGRRVSHRSWHPNGQLEWDETYDERGQQHGTRRHWDTNGVLLATERYKHGHEIR